MGLGESHCNVLLIVRDNPQTSDFEQKGEPKQNRTEVRVLTILTPYCWAKATPTLAADRGVQFEGTASGHRSAGEAWR